MLPLNLILDDSSVAIMETDHLHHDADLESQEMIISSSNDNDSSSASDSNKSSRCICTAWTTLNSVWVHTDIYIVCNHVIITVYRQLWRF